MPNRDRTGPDGKGGLTGRGRGYRIVGQETNETDSNSNRGSRRGLGRRKSGQGTGRGSGRRQGRGFGQNRGVESSPSEGFCICPSCGKKVQHKIGQPCYEQKCPNCDAVMDRE